MTADQVVATEEWLRDKAQLSNVRSDEVETLSLHGSYHEKIVTLGDSLLNFKRLKSLDLSRNAIVSLEGLECLQELEKLSLYFNNIQTLEEISSLRHLIHLTELDLRLNPVTSTVENYRQYVIRLLPNLLNLDLRPVHATERNATQFDFISQEQYETSEVDKREESQQMKKVFSYDTDEQNYMNRAQMCKWDGAANIQSDLRPVHATERNATKFDFISQEQYETSEVDKREESQQMKTVFSYDTDQQNYVNQAQMYKWGGASYNQSDVKTTTKYRSCRSIDEDDSTSIRRSGMLSASQISHNGTSTVHRLVDRQQLLSPSNSLTSLRTTCLKRSFTDRKETEQLRSEQNQIHPSEDLRPVRATERNPAKFDFISNEPYESSEVDKREESQQMKKVFSYDTDEQNYVNRAQMCKWDGASNNQSDLRPVRATERNYVKFDFISQEQYETSEVDKREESQQMKKVFSYDTEEQNYVNRAQMCKWDGTANNQSDLRPICATERNLAKFDFISQEYETSEPDKSEESQQMKKVFSYDTDQQNYVNRAQICKWDGASNNQSDLRPVHATERNATQFDLISQEQYETSEVDKREESQQMKKVFSYDTDQQNYVNRAQMCKWGGASNNQSDVKTTTKYRSCRSIDEDDSTSIRRSGMLSTRQISHNGTSTFHRLVDRQLLSPSNSLTSLRTTCSKRSFTDRKETEHLRNEQNQIHPSEDLRPVRATERNATKFDFISQERYETSEVDKREESQQMKKVFSYDTDQQNCVNRAQMCKWGGASNNQSDVKTTTKYRSCRSIDEDDSTSIRRSGMLSTRQISHNGTSTVHRLVDRQLLTPSNSLTSLHTTCSKRSFTDRKETEYLRSEQNQIHPSEDDYRNYQSPVRSSFCSAGKNVCNRSRERLRVTFSDEILIKNNKLSSRSIPKDDSVSCLKSRMPSTSQMPHQETSSCDQQNRASASFTEHTNTEITGNKSSETQSKLTRAHMGYTDKRLEATKTSSLNSLQPSYNGKTTRHKLPEVDQCGDYNPQIPLGLRSGSSANASSHLQNLLDLVDRHWSGSNSLHRNQRFLNSAEELFFNALDTMAISKIQSLEQKVKVLTEESRSLLTRTASGLDSAEFLHIKHELTQKEDDLESLNGKFEKLIEENKKLHSQLRSLELVNSAGLQQRNEELHRENDRLNLQVKYLNQQIKQHNKLKDAVMMLQESHRAIMSYNNYLQELLNASSTGQRTDMSNVLLKDLGPKR